jgi:pyrimidine operon attenuation protein/uracil phosphoribosyltransferase
MKKTILRHHDITILIRKIADEIAEANRSLEDAVLIGIRKNGTILASRIRETLQGRLHVSLPPAGALDTTLYRDDLTRIEKIPQIGKTHFPVSIEDKVVILVDDVLFTGRTVRAAMDALIDFGRPRRVELVVLADRGDDQRELPIKANYVGEILDVAPHERVTVTLEEQGGEDCVTIEEVKAA